MKDQKIRIGQVGITNHGVTILNAIRESSTLQLVSVLDIRTDEAERVSRELGIKQAKDYDEILRDPAIDAVALVTPNQLHARQVEKAVKAGKHVFVEKPLAGTIAEAKKMIARTKKAGLVLMVGHNTRRRRIFRRAKQILESGQLGTIAGVEMNISRSAGLSNDVPSWKANPRTTPLLPMTQLGIHFVDVLHYLFQTTTASVSCFAANTAMSRGVLDSSTAILQLASGVPVALSSYYVIPDLYSVRIFGTGGILSCSESGVSLDLLRDGSLQRTSTEDSAGEGLASFVEEMNEFGECVRSGKKPETGGKEGLEALAVVEAMVRSVKTKRIGNVSSILRRS